MPARRAHTKSRNGCGQCKKRRVRCDLQAPVCSHCKRRGDECDYIALGFGTTTDAHPYGYDGTYGSQDASAPPPPPTAGTSSFSCILPLAQAQAQAQPLPQPQPQSSAQARPGGNRSGHTVPTSRRKKCGLYYVELPAAQAARTAMASVPRSLDPLSTDPLLGHFRLHTSHTLPLIGNSRVRANNDTLWSRVMLIPLLQTAPFVLHSARSISALHIHTLRRYGSSESSPEPNVSSPLDLGLGVDSVPTRSGATVQGMGCSPRGCSPPASAAASAGSSSRSETDDGALEAACAAHIRASAMFRNHVVKVDADNWLAVLAFSFATLIFQLGLSRGEPGFDQAVLAIMTALRSAVLIARPLESYVLSARNSTDPVILMLKTWRYKHAERRQTPVEGGLQAALDKLEGTVLEATRGGSKLGGDGGITLGALAETMGAAAAAWTLAGTLIGYPSPRGSLSEMSAGMPKGPSTALEGVVNAHLLALATLRLWITMVSARPQSWLDYFWWPGSVSEEFMALVSKRDPLALLIVVHWCAVLSRAGTRRWFFEGWTGRAARAAIAEMGSGWEDALEWPKRELGIV